MLGRWFITAIMSCSCFVLSATPPREGNYSVAHQTRTEILQKMGNGSLFASTGFASVSAFLGIKIKELKNMLGK